MKTAFLGNTNVSSASSKQTRLERGRLVRTAGKTGVSPVLFLKKTIPGSADVSSASSKQASRLFCRYFKKRKVLTIFITKQTRLERKRLVRNAGKTGVSPVFSIFHKRKVLHHLYLYHKKTRLERGRLVRNAGKTGVPSVLKKRFIAVLYISCYIKYSYQVQLLYQVY